MEDFTKSTTLRDYLRVVFRHKIVFIIVLIAVIVPVYIWLELRTPLYSTDVKILVSAHKETKAEYYIGIFPQGNITLDHTELVRSNVVLERVVKALKLYEIPLDYEMQFATPLKRILMGRRYEELLNEVKEMPPERKERFLFDAAMGRLNGSIEAVSLKESSLFKISVKDFSPGMAIKLANSVSRSYIIFDLEQQIAELKLKYGDKHSTVIQLENYIKEFQKTLHGELLPDIEAIGPASIKIIEQAKTSGAVGIFNKQFLLTLSFFTSIFLSVVLAYLLEFLNQTFRSPEDVERFLNIPVLGSIPKKKPKNKLLIKEANPANYIYHNLADQLYLLMRDKDIKSILIIDAEKAKETPVVIANLGAYLAQKAGLRVLIIDANLRDSSLSKILNIRDNPGLADVLKGRILFEDAVQDLGENLYVLPASDAVFNPVTLLDSLIMSDVIKKAEEQYEIIFIGCADLKSFTDAVILSSHVGATVLVINEGKVRRQVVKSAILPLEQKKANIIGAILNNRTYVIPKIIYKIT